MGRSSRSRARVPTGRAVSIERETFPSLIEAGDPLFGYASRDYWMDVGTPEKYLRATFDVLEGQPHDNALEPAVLEGKRLRVSLL